MAIEISLAVFFDTRLTHLLERKKIKELMWTKYYAMCSQCKEDAIEYRLLDRYDKETDGSIVLSEEPISEVPVWSIVYYYCPLCGHDSWVEAQKKIKGEYAPKLAEGVR